MHKFHYDYVMTKYNAKLLFTDTNSLVYEISSDSVYEIYLILVNIQKILIIMIFQTKKC